MKGMRLTLFDVDGTLLLTNGAGMRAFRRATRAVCGIDPDIDSIRPDGQTDPLIAKMLLKDRWSAQAQQDLFSEYVICLESEMSRPGAITVLPGVSELLQALSRQSDFAVGLATGNLERGAGIKLEKAGLGGYFRFGGYGSDSENRTTVTKIAIERGVQEIAPEPFDGAYVIGDTPFDVIHGHAAGAQVLAVASARYSKDDLRLYGPELLVSDLTATESIVAFMRGAAVSG